MIISHSEAETSAFGESQARIIRPGWVLGLSGGLGAGKTQFMKGFARAAGYAGRISSPTFGLIHHYETPQGTLFHIDLYRLDTPAEIIAAGLEELLTTPPGVAVVEWIERFYPRPLEELARSRVDLSCYEFTQTSETERVINHAHSRS